MGGSGTRAGWEAGASRKYGLDPDRDRKFFNDVWDEGFDPSHDSQEDFEAHIQSAQKYYRRGQEVAIPSNVREGLSPGVGSGVLRPSNTSPVTIPTAELGAVDSARQWALTEYL